MAGTKKPSDPPWKYVEAFAGSDIQTNPPATNDAVEKSGRTFTRQVDQLPPQPVLAEIAAKVDIRKLEDVLMDEGVHFVSEVLDCPPEEIRADMRVKAVFVPVSDEITLVKFRRAPGTEERGIA